VARISFAALTENTRIRAATPGGGPIVAGRRKRRRMAFKQSPSCNRTCRDSRCVPAKTPNNAFQRDVPHTGDASLAPRRIHSAHLAPSSARNRRGFHCLVRSGDGRKLADSFARPRLRRSRKGLDLLSGHAPCPSRAWCWSVDRRGYCLRSRHAKDSMACIGICAVASCAVRAGSRVTVGYVSLWYHIVFLGSLFPLVVLGAKLLGSRGGRRRI
jgi:hypothetical protein